MKNEATLQKVLIKRNTLLFCAYSFYAAPHYILWSYVSPPLLANLKTVEGGADVRFLIDYSQNQSEIM